MNEAIRDWIANVEDTHYLIGSAAGPHPYPLLVRELQAVISREARAQLLEREGRLPGRRDRLRRRRLERDRRLPRVPRRPRAPDRRRGGRRRRRAPRRLDRRRQGLGAARLAQLRALRRARPGRREPLDLGRARLPGRRPRARVPGRERAAPSTSPCPTPRRSRASTACAGSRASSRRSSRRTRSRRPRRVARELGPDGIVLVCLSGRGDKDVDTVIGSARREDRARRRSPST